jgi:4-oxalocrotonate tautomerase
LRGEGLKADNRKPGFCRVVQKTAVGEKGKETVMPHVLVKLYSGRSEQQKERLAEALSQAVVATLRLDQKSVSVAIEDVEPENWTREVYKPDILNNPKIYKKPGYDPEE